MSMEAVTVRCRVRRLWILTVLGKLAYPTGLLRLPESWFEWLVNWALQFVVVEVWTTAGRGVTRKPVADLGRFRIGDHGD